jgi:HEAT repeat protein
MTYFALVLLAVGQAAPQEPKLYGDATLAQWQERLGNLDPSDPGNAPLVPALISIIDDAELPYDARRPFAMTLGRMGAVGRDAIPVLIQQIERRRELDEPTYAWAARALGLFGVHARQAVPALIDLLFDEDIPQGQRTLPMEALARIGTAHPQVMPALIRLLQYQGQDPAKVSAAEASVFRELAADAISFIGPEADLAAPLLVRVVRDPGETDAVRRKAIVALGSIGPPAALAVPALVETLEFEQTAALRLDASESLGKIGRAALPVLQRYLRHPEPVVRYYAAHGLAQMGDQARPAMRALIAALADPDAQVCLAACESLEAMSASPAAYVPPLIQLLTSDSRQVRMSAKRLLEKLGPKATPFLDQLRALEQHDRASVRAIVRKTLDALES